ncbi:hypothetical protein CerSpe_188280 [Prunus speciosa]
MYYFPTSSSKDNCFARSLQPTSSSPSSGSSLMIVRCLSVCLSCLRNINSGKTSFAQQMQMSLPCVKQPDVITCKAAVAWGAGKPLVVEEVNVNPPQAMEIRIKVVCTSLCRSDITAWESQAIFPRIFGHEATG